MHLTMLGIEMNNNGVVLFVTAIVTFLLAATILFMYKKDIPFIKNV